MKYGFTNYFEMYGNYIDEKMLLFYVVESLSISVMLDNFVRRTKHDSDLLHILDATCNFQHGYLRSSFAQVLPTVLFQISQNEDCFAFLHSILFPC